MNNKIVIFATIPLFVGYYLQDTIFTRSIAKVTSDIPTFVQDIDILKVLTVFLPYLVALVLFYVSNIITTKTLSKIELESIEELTNKIIHSIKTSKKQINVNDLLLHIKKISGAKSIYAILITYIIPTIIVGIGLVYNFIQVDGTYSLIVAILIISMMIITVKLEIDSVGYAYKTESSSNSLYDEIHEIMTNIDSVLTSNTQEKEIKHIDAVKNKTYELSSTSEINNHNTTYGLQLISIFAMFGINYLAYRLYTAKRIDASILTATVLMSLLFMDYYNYCIHAISDLINSIGRFKEVNAYFKDFKIINKSQEQIDREITLKITNGNIEFKNVNIKYDNKDIFKNFNLFIQGGKTTGLLGPIGSGKTTILKSLAGITGYTGDILIDGQNIQNSTYESIVENIAYIPQHPKLFNKSIYYNINYGSCYTKEEIIKKLEELKLLTFINSFPNKLDTIVGKEGSKLSGGQRQFVALIRAIIQNKSILLLDEPSSSLDKKNKKLFIELMNNLRGKKTIIISTHDVEIMQLFDKKIDVMNEKNKKDTNKNNHISRDEHDVENEEEYIQNRINIRLYRQ